MQHIQNTDSEVRDIAQAMSERVDKGEQKMETVRSDQKEEADRAVGYAIFELKMEILCEVDQ